MFLSHLLFGQSITLTGMVLDSIAPLSNANILAFPNSEAAKTSFAISNEKGEYSLKLKKNITYDITISYLGYETLTTSYNALENEIKNFVLKSEPNALDEIELTYKIPIQVKGDETTYNTDAFVNGKERKLRDVLKKLPGIDVDREGNVTAKGKKITKVLVEGKIFFTGNSKLAVNNIPANAVDKVQVFENYNEIEFLKGLQESDDVALNIKLKKDKKKFVFGDIEVGGGVENNYIINPTLFYYSPKTNVNFIGDVNNIGTKSFTFSDYIEFEGGFGKLLNNAGSYRDLAKDDFSQFLSSNDFKKNSTRFGAFNLRQSLSKKLDLTNYVIWNSNNTKTLTNNLNTFINNTAPFEETRTHSNSLDNEFVIGKLALDYNASSSSDLSVNSLIKVTNNKTNGFLQTNSNLNNSSFNSLNQLESFSLKQNGTYSKRFSRAQTISLEGILSYKENEPNKELFSNTRFLENTLLLEENPVFSVIQNTNIKSLNFDFIGKDYWVLNNYNHIYFSTGFKLFKEDYSSSLQQRLINNGEIPLLNFRNSLTYDFNDLFLGLDYKFLTGVFIIKPSLSYHKYTWQNKQLETVISNKTDILLPRFDAEATFNTSEKLRFKFVASTRFPKSEQLIENFLLRSFNSIARGNPNISYGLYNTYSLNYSKFNLLKGQRLIAGINYINKSKSIKNAIALEGIEQLVTYTIFNEPENSIRTNFVLGKRIGNIKFSFEGRGSYNEFYQLLNNVTSLNISKNLSSIVKFKTSFENLPNIELEYAYEPSFFRTSISKNDFYNTTFSSYLDYVWKDFVLKADYSNINFTNASQNISNIFNIANTSLFYQKEDSPWGIELSGTNLFNVKFKQQNSFSNILISDEKNFILPRIVLLKLSYKL